MGYQRLTLGERYQIQALFRSGMSYRGVSRELNRSPSTVSRELHRNRGDRCYYPVQAHNTARRRRRHIHPPYKIRGKLREIVVTRLKTKWSPEQISGRIAFNGIKISHEAIYQFIYREFRAKRSEIYKNCRRSRKLRRTRQATYNYKNKVHKNQNLPNISERPKIVEHRKRLGDMERDTIVGFHGRAGLLTTIDRASRRAHIGKVENMKPETTHLMTVKLLRGKKVHTITNDNGQEFTGYEKTAKALKARIYFNDPYSSWQRGSNENLNGLIRQFFPKGTNFDEVTLRQAKQVERMLNNRPRKKLGYRTPNEVHKMKSQGVALRN